MKKRIVCFGDSNTWGADPKSKNRFDENIRWPTLMGQNLGDNYTIIEEGLCGRTTIWDDDVNNISSGRSYMKICIDSHYPFDIMIIMLGTNDLNSSYSVSSDDIAKSASSLAMDVLNHDYSSIENFEIPKVLLVSPIHTGSRVSDIKFGYTMSSDACEKSKQFAKDYKKYADIIGVYFLDAAIYANPSIDDQLHIDKEGHLNLAKAMSEKVKQIIG